LPDLRAASRSSGDGSEPHEVGTLVSCADRSVGRHSLAEQMLLVKSLS